MAFEKYIAIDWSGAREPRITAKIQVAEYDPANRVVSIVRSPASSTNGRWSRAELYEHIRRWAENERVLIGFDFAFAYPWCDQGGYFPGVPASPVDARHLWKTVERVCGPDDNFYGGLFYRGCGSPYREFHLCHDFRGANYQERYRATDQQAGRVAGHNPCSVFKCVGPNQVGPGSVAGMRFLHMIHLEQIADIWPFDTTNVPNRPTVVEIYPRLFLNHAVAHRGNRPIPGTVEELLERYGATLQGTPESWTDDERDALVSAVGMGWFANQLATWQAPAYAPACASVYEGWIFGA